jgi:hypothetical protein
LAKNARIRRQKVAIASPAPAAAPIRIWMMKLDEPGSMYAYALRAATVQNSNNASVHRATRDIPRNIRDLHSRGACGEPS